MELKKYQLRTYMKYENGNLTETIWKDQFHFITRYTDASGKSIPNNGGVMIYDDHTFGIDGRDYCDMMTYLHYAGLLGKATRDLPLSDIGYGGEEHEYEWQIDENGFPLKFTDPVRPEVDDIECSFSW